MSRLTASPRLRLPADFADDSRLGDHNDVDPVRDDNGYPVFQYVGCGCANCMTLRAQYDSYRTHVIARLGHAYKRRCAEGDDDWIEFLSHGMKKALRNWEPALLLWKN